MDRETVKVVKKKSVKKHKSSKRKKHHDSSGEESIDLSEKIFPIAHYINDREEMIKQVFSVMEKERLNCMLPPILKGMTMGVLKDNCLKELTKMSNDEVQKVLCGESIETLTKKVSSPLNIDSNSCQSLSSVEECTNIDKEKRTLLDILEQEMQEIAYNTVLKRSEEPHTESDDGLPEIVAITPTHSPSRESNNVPLICLDSEDDEPGKSICDSIIENNASEPLGGDGIANQGGADVAQIPNICFDKENVEVSTNTGNLADKSSTSTSEFSVEVHDSNLGHLVKTNNSKENFMIQVFSRNTSSERIVKKVIRISNSDSDLGKNPIVSVDKPDILLKDCELSSCDKNKLISRNNPNGVEVGTPLPTSDVDEIQIIEDNTTSQRSSNQGSDLLVSQLVDSCIVLQDGTNSTDLPNPNDTVPSEKKEEEKEEGEISEEDSGEDVEILESQEDQQQSSTILLSSDDSEVNSDLGRQDHRSKARKHRHRPKGSKKTTTSPERSKRRIEKRGNRSYRRKTTSAVKENHSKNEKVKEASSEDLTSSNMQVSAEVTLEDESKKTVSTLSVESDSLQVSEAMETEICDPPTSPNTLEIHISDTKLDSSEETDGTDSTEPISTKTSWADRWAEKKDLKKVVITSKICQNVRKRILSARRKQTNPQPTTTQASILPPVPPLVLHVEGSVQEYQMLQILDNEEKNEPSSPALDSDPLRCDNKSASESHVKLNLNSPALDSVPLPSDNESVVNSHVRLSLNSPVLESVPLPCDNESVINSHVKLSLDSPALDSVPLPSDNESVINSHVKLSLNSPALDSVPLPCDNESVINSHVKLSLNSPALDSVPLPCDNPSVIDCQVEVSHKEEVPKPNSDEQRVHKTD